MGIQKRRRKAKGCVAIRADAIVGGQHRRHYGDVAVLLAMVADIKEGMGHIMCEGYALTSFFFRYQILIPANSRKNTHRLARNGSSPCCRESFD